MAIARQNPWAQDLDLLPKFTINKIVISESEATLSCALQRPRNLNYENWLGSSEFNSYIKYYFIAAPKLETAALKDFYFEEKRVTNIYRAVAPGRRDFFNWELGLGPQSQRDLDHDHGNPYNLKGYTKLSLEAILQGQYFAKDPLTATESIDPIDPYVIDNSANQNTSFSVEIKLVNSPFDRKEEELNILAFAQLDILRLKEDFGIDAVTGIMALANIGSPLQFERCMVRDEQTFSSHGNFVVPRTRKVFFLPDGSVYSGPVSFRPPDASQGKGYTGFVAGPLLGGENEDVIRPRRLTEREITNTKIVSKLSMERMLNPAGLVISAENHQDRAYFGFVGTPAVDNSPVGSLVFGDEIARTLNAQMGHLVTLGSNTFDSYQDRMRELVLSSVKRGQLNLTNTSVPPDDLSWVNIQDGDMFHGSVFLLKLDDIISNNSRLSHIYDMHSRAIAEGAPGGPVSKSFLATVIKRSRIHDFSVYRRRMTNLARGNNTLSSSDYEIYDTNDPEDFVIRTTGPVDLDIAEVIIERSTRSARIFQHNAHRNAGANPEKIFILEDKALFEDFHFGKYEYIIDITVEDGILNEVERLYREFKESIRKYATYVQEASRPYLDYRQSSYYSGNQFADGAQDEEDRLNAGTTGNYNYSTNQFTESFVQKSLIERSVTDKVVTFYCAVLHVLTASSPLSVIQIDRIKEGLLASNTSLDVLQYFLDLCLKLENRLESILGFIREPFDDMNLGIESKKVAKNIQYPQRLISLRGEARVHARAVDKNAVLVQPDVPRRIEISNNDPRNPEANLANSARIGSFIGLNTIMQADDGEDAVKDSTKKTEYTVTVITDPSTATTTKEKGEALAELKASMDAATTRPPGNNDTLAVLNGLLAKYGSTTMETLMKQAKDEERSQTENKQEEEDRWTTSGTKDALVGSIITTDDSQTFANQTEEEYKELYLKKEALKDMYDTVTSTLAADRMSKSQETSYEEKVTTSTTTEEQSKTESSLDEEASTGSLDGEKFDSTTLGDETSSETSGVVVYTTGDETIKGTTVVNNVTLVTTKRVETNVEPTNSFLKELGW